VRKKIVCPNDERYETLLKLLNKRGVVIYVESKKRLTIVAELTIELIQEIDGLSFGALAYYITDDEQFDLD